MLERFTFCLCILVLCEHKGAGREVDRAFKTHADWPYVNASKKLVLDLHYSSDTFFQGVLGVQLYRFHGDGDSMLVLDKRNFRVKFRSGVRSTKINFSQNDSNTFCNSKFLEVLKRAGRIAPGSYKLYISVNDSSFSYENMYMHDVDTVLSSTSSVRHDFNESLFPRKRSFQGNIIKRKPVSKPVSAGSVMPNLKGRFDKVAKRRGLITEQYQKGDRSYIDIYYEDWIAGRYIVEHKASLAEQINVQEKVASSMNFNSLMTNELDHASLFSQQQTLRSDKQQQKEIKGEIGLTTNLSTGQEQNSGMSNNYYELRTSTELSILGIPVALEALYTSLDNNRQVKSSYVRVHYDADKLKDQLTQSIRSYNNKFEETKSKSMGMEHIYGSAIGALESQKGKLQNELAARGGVIPGIAMDDAAIESKKRKIEELDRKIERYKTLLEQNKNIHFFDSSVAYLRTKDVGYRDLSYKQLTKKANSLLPEGKSKSFLNGLTRLDAGMFPVNASKYTMNGQTMKGGSAGYDMGFCEVGGSIGKTQYIGRDGSMDQYTSYSGQAAFRLIGAQKVMLVYYGYSPERPLLSGNDFFKNYQLATPTFFRPVHIMSLNYDGVIKEFVTVGGEAATSYRKLDEKDPFATATQHDRSAYNLHVDVNIPGTSLSLDGSYDKTGKAFENSTLPISLSGTQQLKLAGRNDFFHSRLSVGVEYNYLVQESFALKGSNTKWGFDVKVNSRRYPSLAVSYKPFTTFRSVSDTFNIAQRPLLGSVWTSKAIYLIKRQSRTLQFLLLYNRNMTTMDTAAYGSKLMQASCSYSERKLTGMVSGGRMELIGASATLSLLPAASNFVSLNTTYQFSKYLGITWGQDLGWAKFGLCKYALNAGTRYSPQKLPVTIALNSRYTTYKISEGNTWKGLYSGNIDISYRFKAKVAGKS